MYYILIAENQKHKIVFQSEDIEQALDYKRADNSLKEFISSDNLRFDQTIESEIMRLDRNLLVNQFYVDCKNKLIATVNELTPLIRKYFVGAENVKFTIDNSLFKKNKTEIDKIINQYRGENFNDIRINLEISDQSIYLSYSFSYETKNQGYSRISHNSYICDPTTFENKNDFQPLKKITLKQYLKAKNDLSKSENQLTELKNKISTIKFNFDL